MIVGVRADEEGSRSKERYFSPRDQHNDWDVADQPPELWNQFKTDFAPGTHVRDPPAAGLDGAEHLGVHRARRTSRSSRCTSTRATASATARWAAGPAPSRCESTAKNVREIIEELRSGKFANIAERSGREQDKEDGDGLETLRREGYM